ncbi:MAG: DNA ligase D [Legionella sp.]|uniref:DNA ligase D n=1 Tax=Legionella sp. TaxID=459 RepID=UPI00283FE42C|nr:DNA ligase D [Legionella sp.]
MSLDPYRKKRDFSQTPEPKGKTTHKKKLLYVIQKHAASHLHYDFRIELRGVLKSWAIPKGPSLDPHVKRLAIHVEDHPIEYGSFEGIIPKGQYGGGTVMLWDEGTWESLDDKPYKAYEQGHLHFALYGHKLKGRWDLIRFKDDNNWFLIKHEDQYAREQKEYDITRELTKSVVSEYSLGEIAKHAEAIWNSKKKVASTNIKPSEFPDFISPQLATLVDKLPVGAQWLHEIKLDGYRILTFKNGKNALLKSRNQNDWTNNFQPVVDAIDQLPFEQLIFDGEIVALDTKGNSDFQLLQNYLKHPQNASLVYYIFDLLYYNGYDLRNLPLIERKSLLQTLLKQANPILRYTEHVIGTKKNLLQQFCNHGYEGIISKQAHGTYHPKRSNDWLKIKCIKRQEFVIGGYTPPKGGRTYFGSLFLGLYNKQGGLDFISKVGTGFTEATEKEIYLQLIQDELRTNPFSSEPPGSAHAHWVKPKLVCEVQFTEWTENDHLRHPSFKGLRFDKSKAEVVREYAEPFDDSPPSPSKEKEFIISNPQKILYPEDQITKQNLLNYYESVSEYMLPYISLRPLTLLRCPAHRDDCFYQRHFTKSLPKNLYPIDNNEKKSEQYIYIKDKEGLLSLVQLDVLEIHPWGSQIKQLDKPDILVFDLDPAPDVPWSKVIAAALELRDYLIQYKLTSFVKSTGGKGLHVVIPITPEYTWDKVKQFSLVFAQLLEELKPKDYISKMNKSKRSGKIFIDYLRNQHTASAISVYSTRARPHAPVSTPLAWDELSKHLEDNSYTIKTLPKRLAQLKKDPWEDFWHIKQSLRLDELLR